MLTCSEELGDVGSSLAGALVQDGRFKGGRRTLAVVFVVLL